MINQKLILTDLSWSFSEEYTPEVIHGVCSNKVFDLIKTTNKLPLDGGSIKFSDDAWDLTPFTLSRINKRKSEYIFTHTSPYYKEQLKFFILTLLWEDKLKIQSIYTLLGRVKNITTFLDKHYIYELQYVSLSTVKQFIDTCSNYRIGTIQSIKKDICRFFEFYCNNYAQFDWQDIYNYLQETDSLAYFSEREANKWPTIPNDYYNRLLSCMVKVMNNTNLPIDERGTAAIFVILSQTGLRQGELTDCTIDALKTTTILNGTKKAYYMDYYTTKNIKGNGNKRLVHTVMTDLAQQAYLILTDIYSERRRAINSCLLFVPLRSRTLPVTENTLQRMLTTFLLKYGKEVGCINVSDKYPELKVQSIGFLIKRKSVAQDVLSQYSPTDTLSIPRNHQFRVYLCNSLYQQGVDLLYIQKHMNHLTQEMTCYYMRPKEDVQRDQECGESTMRSVITGELNLLGDTKDDLMNQIHNFIKSSNLNVEKDLDTIVKKLVKKMPVRAKSGGICIKSGPIRDCRKNDISDEIFCSYGMCPNNFHTFYMVNETYKKFTILVKTISFNRDNKFIKAVEKETNKLKWLTKKYLLPELDDLKEQLKKHGEDALKTKYPQISWHIEHIDTIYQEVSQWIH